MCGGPTPLYKACPESPRLPGTRMRFSMKTMSCHDPKDVTCPKTFAGILDLLRNTDCRPADNPRACDFCSKIVPYVEGNYADAERDCSGFFICTRTVNQYVACAPGLIFNTVRPGTRCECTDALQKSRCQHWAQAPALSSQLLPTVPGCCSAALLSQVWLAFAYPFSNCLAFACSPLTCLPSSANARGHIL